MTKKKVSKPNSFDWSSATPAQKRKKLKSMFGSIYWSKIGGYAHARIEGYYKKLKQNGFKPLPACHLHDESHDGRWVENEEFFIDRHGNVAIINVHYGSTKYDNSFRFEVYPCGHWHPTEIFISLKKKVTSK